MMILYNQNNDSQNQGNDSQNQMMILRIIIEMSESECQFAESIPGFGGLILESKQIFSESK